MALEGCNNQDNVENKKRKICEATIHNQNNLEKTMRLEEHPLIDDETGHGHGFNSSNLYPRSSLDSYGHQPPQRETYLPGSHMQATWNGGNMQTSDALLQHDQFPNSAPFTPRRSRSFYPMADQSHNNGRSSSIMGESSNSVVQNLMRESSLNLNNGIENAIGNLPTPNIVPTNEYPQNALNWGPNSSFTNMDTSSFTIYDPRFAMLGLPVDPYLRRILCLNNGFGSFGNKN